VIAGLIRNLVIGLFHGSVYWNLHPGNIQSRISLLFFAVVLCMMNNQQYIPIFFEDRLLFYREKGAGVYSALPYWLVSTMPFIPQNLISTLLYSVVSYNMTGLQRGTAVLSKRTTLSAHHSARATPWGSQGPSGTSHW
jgi:ABC-type multidrug transport system permease subunit